MIYQVEVTPYARPFRQPLPTSHGIWAVREGAIVTLTDEFGHVGQGEIAPLEWFGTESLGAAIDFCAGLEGWITAEQILEIPDCLPCCQFGFESALVDPPKSPLKRGTLNSHIPPFLRGARGDRDFSSPAIASLLPTGNPAMTSGRSKTNDSWQPHDDRGHRTFKWKIGVAPIADEIQWFRQLHQQLPPDAQLRLDANTGLSLDAAKRWLDEFAIRPIEYLEQPLAVTEFDAMKVLAGQYSTPIALDESIANLQSLRDCHDRGWAGIYVIKPAIVGSPRKLEEFIQNHPIDRVFSSVFETEIGYAAGLQLADRLGCDRALGYGTKDWWQTIQP